MATYIKPDAVKDSSIAKSKLDTALANEINGKQEALTLTVKDNGNIVLANIQGQSKEFMPATPSGDPMHYVYVAAGAEYNDTGADIVKTGMYGDTIIHKSGYWYLNELGDITNEDMREIYRQSSMVNQRNLSRAYTGFTCRTNLPLVWEGRCFLSEGFMSIEIPNFCMRTQMEVFRNPLRDKSSIYPKWTSPASLFYNSNKLRIIIGEFALAEAPTAVAFECDLLEEVRLAELKYNVIFKRCPNLSYASILYMITHEVATSAITITLHPDAYARAMADEKILAALEQHTNISLASA